MGANMARRLKEQGCAVAAVYDMNTAGAQSLLAATVEPQPPVAAEEAPLQPPPHLDWRRKRPPLAWDSTARPRVAVTANTALRMRRFMKHFSVDQKRKPVETLHLRLIRAKPLKMGRLGSFGKFYRVKIGLPGQSGNMGRIFLE